MRIILTTLTIAFLVSLLGTVITLKAWTFGNFIYSFIMTFGAILILSIVAVCVFHLVFSTYKSTKRQPQILIQILTLWCIYNVSLLLINLPDFYRHQNSPGYCRYRSFGQYFKTDLLEGFIIATIFAITVPVVDRFLKAK